MILEHPVVVTFVERGLWGRDGSLWPAVGIGFVKDGELVAGCAFHNWNPDSGVIEMSAYSARRDWLNRDFLKRLFEYPFEEIGCRVVVARFSERNARAARIWRAFGSRLVALPELRAPEEAEIVAILTREAWTNSKFMRQSHGQKKSAPSP